MRIAANDKNQADFRDIIDQELLEGEDIRSNNMLIIEAVYHSSSKKENRKSILQFVE